MKDEVKAKLRRRWLILFSLGRNELATQFERDHYDIDHRSNWNCGQRSRQAIAPLFRLTMPSSERRHRITAPIGAPRGPRR